MNKKRLWILLGGLALFAGFIALAVVLQSAYMLYAASLLPVCIVPYLPDRGSRRRLQAGIDLYLLKPRGADRSEFLVVEFTPGSLNWSKPDLYFPLTEEKYPVFGELKSTNTAALSVLPYDLSAYRRKPGWFRLDLRQLRERIEGLSFTHREVGRFLIRLDDLRSIGTTGRSQPASASSKGLQA